MAAVPGTDGQGSAELREALLGVGAISLAGSDAAAATDEPSQQVLPRGYWQEEPLLARLRVDVLVPDDAVANVVEVLSRFGPRLVWTSSVAPVLVE
ncbi:hypothetical protein QQG74_15695 [Micromonospora sp. FIMYZ51]|uniref:hypothetical protein n=1 Tax=Micromonospora sp. FIMYZ51 TaxID=3051832 RepID=UPI00311D7F61